MGIGLPAEMGNKAWGAIVGLPALYKRASISQRMFTAIILPGFSYCLTHSVAELWQKILLIRDLRLGRFPRSAAHIDSHFTG